MKFSQRFGYTPIKEIIQKDFMDNDLRNSLWNALREFYFAEITKIFGTSEKEINDLIILAKTIWINHFKQPLDKVDLHPSNIYDEIYQFFFRSYWYEVYDLIEFIVSNHPNNELNQKFIKYCNYILKRELSAYQFIAGKLVAISSEEELSEIERALRLKGPFIPVSRHLKSSLDLLSDKKRPDYKNSIKESISAVEAMCKIITGDKKATLGDALKKIEKDGNISLHGALKGAFDKLYGYTSNAQGIRHGSGLEDEPDLDLEDARFMLISCSAFINYLKEKINKAKLKITPLKK